MDISDQELGRLVSFVNRRPWLLEDAKADTLGVTSEGDTSLLRLCAWHVTLEQLKEHLSLKCDSISATNDKGVTCLHMAVYRNSYHAKSIIPYLLQLEPALASTPMKCGSYPLHVLCGHNVTLQPEVFLALLRADPTVVLKQDSNGDTPLSLLWKNVQRFRWARQQHITIDIDMTQQNKGNLMMISATQCLQYSLQMIRAALQKSHNQPLTLTDLCSMPRCPPLLIQLAIQYSNLLHLDLYTPDRKTGCTAMHHAAKNPPMTTQFTVCTIYSQSSVLELLLEAVPCLATVKDHSGRIPLHYALLHNCNSQALHALIAANPDCLAARDPVTRLYPFALAALECRTQHNREEEGKEGEIHQLSTIVSLLRQFPEAATYHY